MLSIILIVPVIELAVIFMVSNLCHYNHNYTFRHMTISKNNNNNLRKDDDEFCKESVE